ncbi:MAG: carbohydrate kinase family protein [Actinobacteria bacterium]|nr:carbohydrate kinase family protein [Actinomycetota bacterium]
MDMIAFGSVFLELVFGHVPALPLRGEEVFTDEFAISCGGAVTSASAAARGGAHAGLCTVLGSDLGSRVVIEHCARAGVDLSPAVRVRYRSAGISVVLNFDGDRAFVTHVPPRPPAEQPELQRWQSVLQRERPRWCYLHAGPGRPGFLRDARELGARVVLDISLGDERNREIVVECVRLADIFVPNEEELRRLTGTTTTEAAVAAAAGWGTPLVVKRGAAGALVAGPDGVTAVADGVRQVTVRDLTGAGDAFAGAMIAALVRGAPLTEAVVAANAAGSEAVARLGASGEVDIPGISTADRTLGALFVDTVARAATQQAAADAAARGAKERDR